MNSCGLTRENLLSTLPAALRLDKSVAALADAVAGALSLRPEEIDRLRIYPDIGRLDETMLDILAYDFKVDWWDGNYALEAKRRTLRDSWNVHRTLGTRYAVETALNDVYPGAGISEWFEYGGTPYCFKISLPISGAVTLDRQRRMLSKVWYYKNLRSHLEAFQLELETAGNLWVGACTMASETVEIWPELVTDIEVFGAAPAAAYARQTQTMEIYPGPVTGVEVSGMERTAAYMRQVQTLEIYPDPVTGIEVGGTERTAAFLRQAQTIEVYPEH